MSRQPVRHVGWRKTFRVWVAHANFDYGVFLGLPLAALTIVAIWLIADPQYPGKAVTGHIVGPTTLGRSSTSGVIAVVDGLSIKVSAPLHFGCEAGEAIRLREFGWRWGRYYQIDVVPDPCPQTSFRH